MTLYNFLYLSLIFIQCRFIYNFLHACVKLFYACRVEPKRIIIREGHQAENFYFILSGSAIARKLVNKDGDDEDVELINHQTFNKGDSFGVS